MPKRRGDRKKGSRWSCLHVTFAVVMWCWVALIYLYWRNLTVREVMDEFVQAETQIIKDDLKIVADAIDHDIIPKMKSLERMKMVPTLPDVSGATSAGREGHALLPQSKREAVKTRLETDRVGEQTSLGPQRLIEHDAAVKHKKRDQIDKAQSVQKSTEPAVHVVFSTDCSPFQDWQTLLVFHSARVVAQQGHITRIASGCSDKKQVELVTLYKKLWPNYYVHFTPDFKKDAKTKKKYDFYNKPYGVQHWLEHAEPPVSAGVIVALIDPDFVFLRPLTAKVKGNSNNLVSKPVEVGDIFDYVSKGHPVAQQYGLGAPWVYDSNPEFNRTKICGADSACRKVPDHKTGAKYWSVGPPYLLERDDLHRLTQAWTRFVPLVYEDYPQLLAEMYAYSMAGAHEKLPHLRLDNYMVSNVEMDYGEGWKWIDALDDVCLPPLNGIYFPDKPLPNFLHYCQFFSCEQDLLLEPPKDLGFATYMMRNGNREEMDLKARKRNGFALCVLHRSINAAAMDYKERMCGGNLQTSYNKTLNVIENENY